MAWAVSLNEEARVCLRFYQSVKYQGCQIRGTVHASNGVGCCTASVMVSVLSIHENVWPGTFQEWSRILHLPRNHVGSLYVVITHSGLTPCLTIAVQFIPRSKGLALQLAILIHCIQEAWMQYNESVIENFRQAAFHRLWMNVGALKIRTWDPVVLCYILMDSVHRARRP